MTTQQTEREAFLEFSPHCEDVSGHLKASYLKEFEEFCKIRAPLIRENSKLLSTIAQQGEAVAEYDIEAAAATLSECMDYPWSHMPEQGRENMRKHAKSVIDAALISQKVEG